MPAAELADADFARYTRPARDDDSGAWWIASGAGRGRSWWIGRTSAETGGTITAETRDGRLARFATWRAAARRCDRLNAERAASAPA